jgi:hypothetical protein
LILGNAKGTIAFPGVLVVGVSFAIAPQLLVAVLGLQNRSSQAFDLLLAALPLVLLNFIYYSLAGVPVGFSDTHTNIIHYEELFDAEGKVIFGSVREPSFNFVGMFLVFRVLSLATDAGVVLLAAIVPPLINVAVAVMVYLMVRRLHSHRVALLAAVLFGWENQVIIFGEQMRTQTIGTLLLFMIILIGFVSRAPHGRRGRSETVMLVVGVMSTVTVSFVSVFYAGIMLMAMLIAIPLFSRWFSLPSSRANFTWGMYLLMLTSVIGYLLYVGVGFDRLIQTLAQLVASSVAEPGPAQRGYSAPPLFGPFVITYNRVFLGTFAVCSLLYLRDLFARRSVRHACFVAGFGILMIFWIADIFLGPLSSARVFIVGFALVATIVSYGFLRTIETSKTPRARKAVKAVACGMVVLFASASLVSNPQYVIGNVFPLRSTEPIDSVHYWNQDSPQYALSAFLFQNAGTEELHPFMLIMNYRFLEVARDRELTIRVITDASGAIRIGTISARGFVVLHDKFSGADYTNRVLLPPSDAFDLYDQVYSNGDYLLFVNSLGT